MLLAIKKIDSTVAKDQFGAIKTIPGTTKPLMNQKILDEAIDVNLIKSIRPFHKSGKSYADIDGDVSVIYFRSSDKTIDSESEKEKVHEMHVVCNWEILLKDGNTLRQGRSLSKDVINM